MGGWKWKDGLDLTTEAGIRKYWKLDPEPPAPPKPPPPPPVVEPEPLPEPPARRGFRVGLSQPIFDKDGYVVDLGHRPVIIPDGGRQRGSYLLGAQGMGKTSLILRMLLDNLETGTGFCLIEPHGDLTDDLLANIPREEAHRIYVVDPRDGFGLNLFDCRDIDDPGAVSRTTGSFLALARKLWGDTVAERSMGNLMRCLARVFIANPGHNLAHIEPFLRDSAMRDRLVANVGNAFVRDFWVHTYDELTDAKRREMVSPILRRLGDFLSDDLIYPMVSAPRTTVPMGRALREGWGLIIRLPKDEIGEEVVQLVGAVMLDLLLQSAFSLRSTPAPERRPFHVYCDEYQIFATEATAELYKECRKFNIGLLVAHQTREDLDKANLATTLNAESTVCFRVNIMDASPMGRNMGVDPAEIVGLTVGEAFVKIGGYSRKVTVDPLALPEMDEDAEARLADIRRRSRDLFRPEPERRKVAPEEPGPAPEFFDALPEPRVGGSKRRVRVSAGS